MADRFPSLDDFDAGQTEVHGQPSLDALDSEEPSDFLARERAALGDDAQQFTTTGENVATVADADDDGDDDLLGGGGNMAATGTNGKFAHGEDMGEFESSFPAIDTQNEAVAPGGSITGSTMPYRAGDGASYEDETEPEVVRAWRERRDAQLEHRDGASAARKAETVKAAQEAVDEFYENYNQRKEKQMAQTAREAEEFLAKREDTTSGGTSWERIAKLVDLSGKGSGGGAPGTGKARMRELLISLRKDEGAPGATGV